MAKAAASKKVHRTSKSNISEMLSQSFTPTSLSEPGKLERLLEDIKQSFNAADKTHRETIDTQVINCFRIAYFLKGNVRSTQGILGGEWREFLLAHKGDRSKALMFVFKKAHSNAKKASFYCRATQAMFDEGVKLLDIPKKVTAGGGYQSLADKLVKFPRNKDKSNTLGSADTASKKLDSELEPAAPRARRGKQADYEKHDAPTSPPSEGAMVVTLTFEDTSVIQTLKPPCTAILGTEVSQNSEGEWILHISSATPLE